MKLTPAETAKRLGRSPRTLARWRAEGAGPAAQTDGRRVYYEEEEIERWLRSLSPNRHRERDWDRFHEARAKAGQILRWPDEEVVREAARWKREGIKSVLDVQCGAGRHTHFLDQEGFLALGLDLSPRAIAQAKELYGENLFDQADARHTGCPSQSQQALLSWRSLHVFSRHEQRVALEEIFRVLQPGGWLLLSTRSRRNIYRDKPETFPTELGRRQLHRLLQEAGFVQVEIDLSERTYDGGRYRDSWWVARARRGAV